MLQSVITHEADIHVWAPRQSIIVLKQLILDDIELKVQLHLFTSLAH